MPKPLKVVNRTRNTVLVKSGLVADTYWTRFMGLMGKQELAPGFGLLLENETAIHTFGMRLAIDVVYLSGKGIVLQMTPAMPPMRLGPLVRGVRNVLELPIGTLAATETLVGDQLVLEFV